MGFVNSVASSVLVDLTVPSELATLWVGSHPAEMKMRKAGYLTSRILYLGDKNAFVVVVVVVLGVVERDE